MFESLRKEFDSTENNFQNIANDIKLGITDGADVAHAGWDKFREHATFQNFVDGVITTFTGTAVSVGNVVSLGGIHHLAEQIKEATEAANANRRENLIANSLENIGNDVSEGVATAWRYTPHLEAETTGFQFNRDEVLTFGQNETTGFQFNRDEALTFGQKDLLGAEFSSVFGYDDVSEFKQAVRENEGLRDGCMAILHDSIEGAMKGEPLSKEAFESKYNADLVSYDNYVDFTNAMSEKFSTMDENLLSIIGKDYVKDTEEPVLIAPSSLVDAVTSHDRIIYASDTSSASFSDGALLGVSMVVAPGLDNIEPGLGDGVILGARGALVAGVDDTQPEFD